MTECALLLALLLHRPPALVASVYEAAGLDGVAVVECESQFNPRALRREPRGHTSWGLFQLDDEWHAQHRGDLLLHIVTGAAFLAQCKRGVTFAQAVSLYNSGSVDGNLTWGRYVERRRDSLALYLWRRMR
jgi:hypothetical protein